MNQHNRRYFVRQPLTAFDAIAQGQLTPGPAHAASRLFHQGELDDIPVTRLLTSLGCTER